MTASTGSPSTQPSRAEGPSASGPLARPRLSARGEGLARSQKVANIERDPRVTSSMEADGEQFGMRFHLVVEVTAAITAGGAPALLHELAQRYVGPGAEFPPMPDPPEGFVIRVTPTKVRGMAPWSSQ